MNCSPPTHCQSWKSGNENKLSTKIIFPASQCSQAKTRCIQVPGICTSIDEESEWTNSASFCWFCALASVPLSLSCLALSVICVYDNHCCVRLSVQLFTKESKYRKKLQTADTLLHLCLIKIWWWTIFGCGCDDCRNITGKINVFLSD